MTVTYSLWGLLIAIHWIWWIQSKKKPTEFIRFNLVDWPDSRQVRKVVSLHRIGFGILMSLSDFHQTPRWACCSSSHCGCLWSGQYDWVWEFGEQTARLIGWAEFGWLNSVHRIYHGGERTLFLSWSPCTFYESLSPLCWRLYTIDDQSGLPFVVQSLYTIHLLHLVLKSRSAEKPAQTNERSHKASQDRWKKESAEKVKRRSDLLWSSKVCKPNFGFQSNGKSETKIRMGILIKCTQMSFGLFLAIDFGPFKSWVRSLIECVSVRIPVEPFYPTWFNLLFSQLVTESGTEIRSRR